MFQCSEHQYFQMKLPQLMAISPLPPEIIECLAPFLNTVDRILGVNSCLKSCNNLTDLCQNLIGVETYYDSWDFKSKFLLTLTTSPYWVIGAYTLSLEGEL